MDGNGTSPRDAYEDKVLNLGFVFRSLWRQQLGDGSATDELMVASIIFSKIF